MSKYRDRISQIIEMGEDASKADLSQAVALCGMLIGDEAFEAPWLMEGISLMTENREDVSESEYIKLMEGDAIADFDLLEGI
jgi:hypothetical protein